MLRRVTKICLLISNLIFSSRLSCVENWSALAQILLVVLMALCICGFHIVDSTNHRIMYYVYDPGLVESVNTWADCGT